MNPVSPADLVRPLQGTDSTHSFSRGNTLPFCQRPWAMTAWTPQTHDERWLFQYRHPKLQGFRASRQPSPWIGDYAPLTLWPQQGPLVLDPKRRASAYRVEHSTFAPFRQKHFLLRDRCRVDLAPSERCAILRFDFEAGAACRLVLDVGPAPASFEMSVSHRENELRISTRFNSGGAHENFTGYYVLRFSKPITGWGFQERGEAKPARTHKWSGEKPQAFVEFAARSLEVRVASSFISWEQAARNLEGEIGDKTLEDVAEEGRSRWNEMLGRIRVSGPNEDHSKTFYTCLYRSLCFPRLLHEKGPDGALLHKSPYDGKVHPGPLSADNGFWDTHRTVYSLYSLAFRDELGVILEGWLSAFRESGWLPTWSSPGHRACMIGTHIDAVFADAIAKDIPGFDRETAFAGMWKNATVAPPDRSVGRHDLADYLRLGFLPDGKGIHSVSATLDHAYTDACIARAARALGKVKEAVQMEARASNWKNLFDAETGFARPKTEAGAWVEPFDPYAWGGPYVEASAWQCSLSVPHDPQGLIAHMGGPEALVKRLDAMLASPPLYRIGAYGDEIHEMTEMAVADFGLYAHSNQPSHGLLWWYNMAGEPHKAQHWVRRILEEYYGHGPDGLPGDEDNGEMGGWFVLAAIGLYPFCVGNPAYTTGSPLFPEIAVDGGDGRAFRIETENWTPANRRVKARTLAGKDLAGLEVGHRELLAAGSLRFEMMAT